MKLANMWRKVFPPSWNEQFQAEQKAIIAAELEKLGACKAQIDIILSDIKAKKRTYR